MSVASRMAANAAKFPDLDMVKNEAGSRSRVHSAPVQDMRLSNRLSGMMFERCLRCRKRVAAQKPRNWILARKQTDRVCFTEFCNHAQLLTTATRSLHQHAVCRGAQITRMLAPRDHVLRHKTRTVAISPWRCILRADVLIIVIACGSKQVMARPDR